MVLPAPEAGVFAGRIRATETSDSRQRLLLLTNGRDHGVNAFVRGLADATLDKPCGADQLRKLVHGQIGRAPAVE